MINYGKQNINKKDISAVIKTLQSNYLTTGPNTKIFERNFQKKIKCKFALSTSSGTSAIHLALLALNIKKGDVVIIPVINFIASLNMLEHLKAKVYFADVNRHTGQMTPETLKDCIKKNKLKKIKLIITMYNGGNPLNAEKFYDLKKKYKFKIMEDACHALGGKYHSTKNSYVGSCKFSDIATFSFHPLKSITTCEGGMVTTNDTEIQKKIKQIRNHGMYRKKTGRKNYNWFYKIVYPGFNYRLSDVNCSLGNSQLSRLDTLIKKRVKVALMYKSKLNDYQKYVNLPEVDKNKTASHLFIINFKLENLKISRDEIIKKLYNSGITTQVHYIPINTHPYYKKYNKIILLSAKEYFKRSLSLPIYPDLSEKKVDYICSKIKHLINKYKNKR